MATHFVDSNASGSNDGTSWTDAWQWLSDSTGVAAGDLILIASDHSETTNADVVMQWSNGTFAAPVKIMSANSTTSAYERGAQVYRGTTYTIYMRGNLRVEGVEFKAGYGTAPGRTHVHQVYRDCKFTQSRSQGSSCITSIGNTNASGSQFEFIDCDLELLITADRANAYLDIHGSSRVLMRGGSWTSANGYQTGGLTGSNYNTSYGNVGRLICEDADLTYCDDILAARGVDVICRRCKLKSGYNIIDTALRDYDHGSVLLENCAVGTISAPTSGIYHYADYRGDIKQDDVRYRTGGANDGETTHSWELITTANTESPYTFVRSPPLVRWVDAGASQTVTVYIAGAADLNDDDFWIEVSSPNETADPNQTAIGNFQTTRANPESGGSSIPRSSGTTWEGTGTGTDGGTGQQKVSVTISPTEPGPVSVRCCLAKPSTTVYVDPRVDVDGSSGGRDRAVEGAQFNNLLTGSGSRHPLARF